MNRAWLIIVLSFLISAPVNEAFGSENWEIYIAENDSQSLPGKKLFRIQDDKIDMKYIVIDVKTKIKIDADETK